MFGLTIIYSASILLSCHGRLFKFLQEFRLKDGINSQILYVNLDGVSSIESFLNELRIFNLILEEASEVLIFLSS